jgi:hypothetical protein
MSVTLLTTAGQDLMTEGLIEDLKEIINTEIEKINTERAQKVQIELKFVEQRWNSTPRNNTESLKEM